LSVGTSITYKVQYEVAAFGDDHNAIEMLRNCGIGVAVENAIDKAKAAADYLCDTNDNYGNPPK
jgi:hydroxymethylpyrimidine pyrophosphatase-like HAD family hydrolase